MAVTKQEVRRLASEVGFDLVRVTTAEPFVEWERAVKERIAKGLIPLSSIQEEEPFRRMDEWADPARNLEGARSVVVVGMRYLVRGVEHDPDERVLRGRFARQNWRDAYGELYSRRDRLVDRLSQVGARCAKRPCLPNKPAMARSGMGSYGMNGVIQTREHGSWVLATTVATDAVLEPDAQVEPTCDGCRACIDACPTGAIVRPYVVDVGRCLTHVLAVAGPIPMDLRPGVGDRINGCDACQEACPHNRRAPAGGAPALAAPATATALAAPGLVDLLLVRAKAHRRLTRGTALWRHPRAWLQRNAAVALGNAGDHAAVAPLGAALRESRFALVRGHAAWALGRLGGPAARAALEAARGAEPDAAARREIDAALTEAR